MKRLIAHVSGKVDGVGYSSIVATLARTLDLKGYIEILSDGKAFIIAEGPKDDLAKFVSAIRIDNERIKVEGILIDCREATGEFCDFHKILPGQEMQQQPSRESMIDNFLQAPVKLERMDCEICVTDHKLKRAGSALERPEDAIELSREKTSFPGSRWQLFETAKKETEKKAIFK
jgi:acylphosphatase